MSAAPAASLSRVSEMSGAQAQSINKLGQPQLSAATRIAWLSIMNRPQLLLLTDGDSRQGMAPGTHFSSRALLQAVPTAPCSPQVLSEGLLCRQISYPEHHRTAGGLAAVTYVATKSPHQASHAHSIAPHPSPATPEPQPASLGLTHTLSQCPTSPWPSPPPCWPLLVPCAGGLLS